MLLLRLYKSRNKFTVKITKDFISKIEEELGRNHANEEHLLKQFNSFSVRDDDEERQTKEMYTGRFGLKTKEI